MFNSLCSVCTFESSCFYFHSSYDPDTDKWTSVKSMHYNRLAVGVAVVNRLLYAIGGYDGNNRHSSCECYHPENDEWTMINPMQIPRSGAGTITTETHPQ